MIEAPRDELDEAIDRVAAKMGAVPGESRMLQQVIARLPKRESTPWFMTMCVQVTAAAALVLVAFLWARPSREVTSRETLPVADRASIAEVPPLEVPTVTAPIPDRRSPIPDPRSLIPDPRSPIGRLDDERSLAPVETLTALELGSIAAPVLELEAAVVFAPLVLTELVLASDSSSPR